MSELLIFNASLIILAPSAPIQLPVFISFYLIIFLPSFIFLFSVTSQVQFNECTINLQCFTYHFCSFIPNPIYCSFISSSFFIFFFIYLFSFFLSHPKFSLVSVLLIFNASLIIFAPSSPIYLSVLNHNNIYRLPFSCSLLSNSRDRSNTVQGAT